MVKKRFPFSTKFRQMIITKDLISSVASMYTIEQLTTKVGELI